MKPPEYWDTYTVVGPRVGKHPAEAWSLAHLKAEMEHCQVGGAMVLSTQSVHYDAHTANLRLARELAGEKRLRPIWNTMPDATGEFPAPDELLRHLREWQVRAVALFPKTNGWNLFDSSSHSLLTLFSDHALPVYLPRAEFETFEALNRLLEQWPGIRWIIPGIVWTEQRFAIPLLRKHRHLHITFDRFQIHYGPEDLVEQGLEDQLLYGSCAPAMSMGAHRCYIDYAEISPAAKQKIASGNLIRLLGEGIPLPDAAPQPACDDLLMQAARQGLPLPVPVIDMHMHLLDEGLHGGGGSYRMKSGDLPGILKLLGRIGCTGGGFMSWNGTVSADAQSGNACISAALDHLPPGFWGLGTFDPTHYTQSELECMIPALYADRRFLGMKPYRVYEISYDSPLYDVWWRYGNERGLYALIHRTRGDFSEVIHLAEKYPRVQWVVAHCGASFPVADMAIEAVRRYPNIYAEITLTPVGLGVIDYLAAGCGPERVLYGSDLPMRDPRQQFGWVVHSRLPVESKIKILGGNALEIIRNIAL